MLIPKKVKHRKWHRPRRMNKGVASRTNTIAFGSFGLKSTSHAWVSSRQIEAARRVLTRYVKRGGKIWIRIFPDRPVTRKGSEVPMGGGKGGVTVNPKELSKTELEKLSRGWVQGMLPILGPKKDVPAPDVNTTGEIMGWMTDEFEKLSGDTTRATFTGKSLDDGGSEGRSAATGLGGFYVFDALKDNLHIEPGASVVIQGFGNVGGFAAKIFTEHGYRVIGVSDSKQAIVSLSGDGLDITAVEKHKKEMGVLDGFPNTKTITNEALLEIPCDVLIPAALENQITESNASKIQAKVILELANGPTTPEADEILYARGIPVVPDILANAGGVTVSTFEWKQNLKGEHWSEQDVYAKLKTILDVEAKNIFKKSVALKTDLRRSAFIVALERLQKAMQY